MTSLCVERPAFQDAVLALPDVRVTCRPQARLTELRGGDAFREHRAWDLLPATHGSSRQHGGWRALWLRPDGWLLNEPLDCTQVRDTFGEAAEEGLCRLTDLSHSLVRVGLEGVRAAELLAMGTAVDLRPQAFGTGCCTRTRCADFTVVIEHRAPAIDVYVDTSLAAAFWAWIRDAGSVWVS